MELRDWEVELFRKARVDSRGKETYAHSIATRSRADKKKALSLSYSENQTADRATYTCTRVLVTTGEY